MHHDSHHNIEVKSQILSLFLEFIKREKIAKNGTVSHKEKMLMTPKIMITNSISNIKDNFKR